MSQDEATRKGAGGDRETGGDNTEDEAARTTAGLKSEPGLFLRLENELGILDDLVVTAFRSHGGPGWLRVKGRLIEAKGVDSTDADEGGKLDAVLDTIRRLESDEIPGAKVVAKYAGDAWETVTDDEGYFSFRLEPEEPVDAGWHTVPLWVDPPFEGHDTIQSGAPVMVPSTDAEFAVLSDLDDTVIRTHATQTLQQIRMVFGNNARTRPPFPGVAALYRALSRGPDGEGDNPFFYVSLSGWNLYDLFQDFFDYHDIPQGAFFMQDLTIFEESSTHISTDAPKLERAAILMENYPELPFVLIGDSGQADPETYRRVVDRHPGRVKAVYIRDVTPDERDDEVRAIAREVEAKGVPMTLVRDSEEAAEHAAGIGLIAEESVEEIRREVRKERKAKEGERDA